MAPRRLGTFGRTVGTALLVLALIWTLFPVYWMLITSLKTNLAMFQSIPQLWPAAPTLENYSQLATGASPVGRLFTNSVITSLATALVTVLLATLAGYSFSRGRYRLKGPMMYGILATQMFPLVVLLIPLYLVYLRTRLLDTYVGLVLAYCAFSVPFGAWMMKAFIDSVPREIEEAAWVDGCSRLQSLLRVVIFVALPGIVATGVFAFLSAWNNLLFPLTLTSSMDMKTLPPGLLLAFTGQFKADWAGMMAAATITTAPVVLGFAVVQRYLVEGLTKGAVRG
ncbi:MAG TPA: carbohydrate ABC transporter permease [bacterium]|nr:carbohydrate ABC transporter permease [bacterium]